MDAVDDTIEVGDCVVNFLKFKAAKGDSLEGVNVNLPCFGIAESCEEKFLHSGVVKIEKDHDL